MPGGSTTQPEQVTKSVPSAQQQELMDLALPGVRKYAANVPKRYSGSTIAGFDPSQIEGQGQALGAAYEQNQLARSGADTSNAWLSPNVWDPAHNAGLKGAIDASVRPITQNLTETQLPALRGESVATGNFGGSRQGIAEGLASGRASQAIGDTASKVAQNEYETNVNAQMKALGLLPQTQDAQLASARTTSGVGDVRQAMEQARLGENVNNFNYDQLAPFLQSKDILSLLQGLPGGETHATGNTPQSNPWMPALGGAASGATLGTALMPGIGTGLGALGGGLMGYLASRR